METSLVFTLQDAIDHLVDYLGGTASDQVQRDSRRAAQDALRDLCNAHRWTYHYTHGRLATSAPQTTGTVAYTNTGGAYERMLTLSGGTWPSWVKYGQIRIGSDPTINSGGPIYEVDQMKSATVVTLDETLNPGADIVAGTSYTLYRDSYVLPIDFIAQDEDLYQDNFADMVYIHPRHWMRDSRYTYTAGVPRYYSIMGDRNKQGRMVTRVFPAPDAAKTIDFLYQRRPVNLILAKYSTGSVSVAAGSNAVTGVSTAWTDSMAGSAIRFSTTSAEPTNSVDSNPFDFETTVIGLTSATGLILADAPTSSYSSVGYTISNVIDIEDGAMLTAYKRGLEKQISIGRVLKDKPSARALYDEAFNLARDADSRSFAGRKAGDRHVFLRRLINMPISFADET